MCMTADARSLSHGGDTFDFDSQTGILFVLRAIRAADIKIGEKNTLKDLVFLYSTGGKDESVKKKLADTLTSLNVTPASILLEVPKEVAVPQTEVQAPGTSGFMGGRLTPVFQAPVVPTTSLPTPATPPVPSETVKLVVPDVAPVMAIPAVVAPIEFKPKVAAEPVEKIAPVAPVVRPVVPVPQPVAVEPVVSAAVIPGPEPINVEVVKKIEPQIQTPTEIAPEYVAARMERIRVIKSDVNARVGNPVNLVDVDNTLGREYMSALLEAMKLLSSASEQESSKAMSRLETVYTQVLALLDTQVKRDAPEATAPVIVEPTPVVNETPIPPLQQVPETVAPVAPVIPVVVPVVRSVAQVSVPVQNNASPTSPITAPAEDFVVRSKVSERPSAPIAPSNWDSSAVAAIDVVPSVGSVVAPQDTITVARLSTPPAEPLRPVVSPVSPVYTPEVTPSVGEVTPLRAITELPTADEVSAVEAMGSNPLYTKDIDSGLDQLLSEWAIFKKSGMFGTGPKGREHPLYIKIAPMQVPLILSGRFEGSTQEIKQSITDYMNGWRYEQGIIYEANETFDQYLRRVIRHIIDLQKTKRRS
jgi:hypothetical protein